MRKSLHLGLHLTLLLFLTCPIFFSCKKAGFKEEVIFLTPDKEMDELSDSTFFGIVKCLVEHKGDIYASLSKRMQIVKLDKELNLKSIIGKQGRGPGEFININNFVVADENVLAGNPGVLALMKFTTEGRFIGVADKTQGRYSMSARFTIEDGVMYFSKVDHDKKTSLAILDLNNDEENAYKQFGSFTDFGTPTKNDGQNKRHVFVTHDHIIAVPLSIPVIEKYDKKTLELLEIFDLTMHPTIKNMYKTALELPGLEKPNMTYELIRDAYLKDDFLYIIYPGVTGIKKDNKPEHLGALVFDISDNIKYIKRYTFPSEIDKLCVTDNYIYGAPLGGGVIDRYPLDK